MRLPMVVLWLWLWRGRVIEYVRGCIGKSVSVSVSASVRVCEYLITIIMNTSSHVGQ